MRLGRNRIGGAMQHQHLGLDVALAGGIRRRQHAVDRHHRGHVGAFARQIEHVGAAVTVADRRAPLGIADAALRWPLWSLCRRRPRYAAASRRHRRRSGAPGTPSGSRCPSVLCLLRTCRRRTRHSLARRSIWPIAMLDSGVRRASSAPSAAVAGHCSALVVDQLAPAAQCHRRNNSPLHSSSTAPLIDCGRGIAKSQPSSAPRISCA